MKTLGKATLESQLSRTLSTSQDWTTSLWYWRHLDGETTAETRKRMLPSPTGFSVYLNEILCKWKSEPLHFRVFRFSFNVTVMSFSQQAGIRVCRADWTSLFSLWEKIKSAFTDESLLETWGLKTHGSHVWIEELKCQRTKVVVVNADRESVLLLSWINMLQVLFDMWGVVLFTMCH